jgi:hypothetical protein
MFTMMVNPPILSHRWFHVLKNPRLLLLFVCVVDAAYMLSMYQVPGWIPFIWRFPRMGVAQKWMAHNRNSIYKWMIWGYPHFRNPSYQYPYGLSKRTTHFAGLDGFFQPRLIEDSSTPATNMWWFQISTNIAPSSDINKSYLKFRCQY